jgi:hypothetical protein
MAEVGCLPHFRVEQVFGLVSYCDLLSALPRHGPVTTADFVLTYRCGAVLDFHEVPFPDTSIPYDTS